MKKRLIQVVALFIITAMLVSPVSALAPAAERGPLQPNRPELVPGANVLPDKFQADEPELILDSGKSARYIVLFKGESLVVHSGGAAGLDVNSVESANYLDSLAVQRAGVLASVEAVLGRGLEVRYVYDVILNGVSAEMTPAEAAKLASVEGVRKVLLDKTYELDTDAGPKWLGADTLWDGTADPTGFETKGEGILVGILDSGINFDHPSFSETPADGFVYFWPDDFLGVCAPDGDPNYAAACNKKVVGAYSYTMEEPTESGITPEDTDGHGSHTASTVAGNTVALDYYGTAVTISGMAPHAQIISYDVCYPTPDGGQCAGEDSVAAVQQAIVDRVDVINYSISGGENPYQDAVELAFLEATDAGVVVSTSAGNEGPGPDTVAHRSPWLLSTAASTHDRKFTSVVDFSNTAFNGIQTLAGEIPFTMDVLSVPVRFAGEDGNPLGCADPGYATPSFYNGAIALIKRGTCTFSEKVLTAAAAGATGVLVYTDTRPAGAMSMDGTSIPSVMLDIPGTTGDAIATWVAAATGETVSISAFGADKDDAYADIMADFSSRGPNTTFDVLKPDVSAPGMVILAAYADGEIAPSVDAEFDLLQGTSMSSPHDAGAAALLYALHPFWTPAEIKSALMLTAYDGLLKEDKVTPADPFDIGAGRIQLELAGLTGLVMDESYENYLAADPAEGGDVRELNLASLYNSQCVGECSWTRTFTSVAATSATYTVTAPAWLTVDPTSFTIAAGATQTISFTADVAGAPADTWMFGKVSFETSDMHAETLFYEDFGAVAFPPTGWSIVDVDGVTPGWIRSAGLQAAYHGWGPAGTNQSGWLLTPQVSLGDSPFISFWENENGVTWYAGHYLMVCDASENDCSTAPTNYTMAYEIVPADDGWAPREFDLSAYANKDVRVAFQYTGEDADGWYVDDVTFGNITTKAISDVAIPVAVMPASSNVPTALTFETHRDAEGAIVEDLVAVEITEGTVYKSGLAKGVLETIALDPDPTPSDAVDDLSQVYVKKIVLPAYSIRLVNEIVATTAADLDIFLYWDADADGALDTTLDELIGTSATSAALEYLEAPLDYVFYNEDDTYFLVVQNWSGSAGDTFTLSTGIVDYFDDANNFRVDIPLTNDPGIPFDMEITWDVDTEEGDRLYGFFETCIDEDCTESIGLTNLDIRRMADDVTKTADPLAGLPGDVITYTVAIQNFNVDEKDYFFKDELPAGVTYVDGSVTGGAVYDPVMNQISWLGTVAGGVRDYVATTSAADPKCTLGNIMPDANPDDDYLDWATTSYAFPTDAGLSGDGLWYTLYGDYPAFNYYGVNYSGLEFTDDARMGFAMMDYDYINQNFPDPTEPNNTMGLFWDDFEVVYDAATNKGITLVGDSATFTVTEYDDVRLFDYPDYSMDVELGYYLQPDDAPGAYEIIFAYDNITPGFFDVATGTIGLENVDGSVGTTVSFNDPDLMIENGSAICFDWALVPAPPAEFTYKVTIDDGVALGSVITNTVVHELLEMGGDVETTNAEISVNDLPVAVDQVLQTNEDIPLSITLTGTDTYFTGTLSFAVATPPAHGTLTGTAPTLTYTPDADFFGMDSFTFTVSDMYSTSLEGTITINVMNTLDGPTAVDDAYWTDFETVLTVAAPGVLANDTDPDPDEDYLVEVVDAPSHGSVVLATDGSFVYTPAAGFRGVDSFTYRMFAFPSVTSLYFDEAEVLITVNDKPLALPQTLSTDEDTPLDITLTGQYLLPGPVVWTVVSGPMHGTLSGTAPDLTYTPNENYYGPDSFSFKVNDGIQDSESSATIAITVVSVNDSPEATDDAYETDQDVVLTVAAPGVLANDFDADPTDLIIADLKDAPMFGTVVLDADGSFVYTPQAGYYGKDTFTYYMLAIPQVTALTDVATVTITIHPYTMIFLPFLSK